MQAKSENFSEYSSRTESLAALIGKKLSDLPALMGISNSMFHAYRAGKNSISEKAWRKLEEVEQAAKVGAIFSPNQNSDFSESDRGARMIPVIGWAHAGEAENYEELPKSWQDQIPTECRDAKAFAVSLEGDSMEPKFSDGDMLIVQPSEEPYSGCYVVARFKTDGVIFRRMEFAGGEIVLRPLNAGWPMTRHQPSEFSWIYPVWGRWTQIWRRR